jgi:hypothetical protein
VDAQSRRVEPRPAHAKHAEQVERVVVVVVVAAYSMSGGS